MKMETLKEMLEYTKLWKQWLEHVPVKPEDQPGKDELLRQMNEVIEKWTKELGGGTPE